MQIGVTIRICYYRCFASTWYSPIFPTHIIEFSPITQHVQSLSNYVHHNMVMWVYKRKSKYSQFTHFYGRRKQQSETGDKRKNKKPPKQLKIKQQQNRKKSNNNKKGPCSVLYTFLLHCIWSCNQQLFPLSIHLPNIPSSN